MQRRNCPRLEFWSSNEAVDWEQELGLDGQSTAYLLEEGTFPQLAAPDKVNGTILQ